MQQRKSDTPSIIILDLDNTLIHSLEPKSENDPHDQPTIDYVKKKFHISPDFTVDGKSYSYAVYKRPYVDDFLKYATKTFDYVVIWSAGTKRYVELIVEKLFKMAKLPQPFMVLTRDDCKKTDEGCRKNMPILRRKLAKKGIQYDHNKILFIDDLPYKIKGLSQSRIYEIKSFDVDKDPHDRVFKSFKNEKCPKNKRRKISLENADSSSSELTVKCLPRERSPKKKGSAR